MRTKRTASLSWVRAQVWSPSTSASCASSSASRFWLAHRRFRLVSARCDATVHALRSASTVRSASRIEATAAAAWLASTASALAASDATGTGVVAGKMGSMTSPASAVIPGTCLAMDSRSI